MPMAAGKPASPNTARETIIIRRISALDPAIIADAVNRTTGRTPLGTPTFIPRGLANEDWMVDTDTGPVLVKVGPSTASMEKLESSHKAITMALEAGVQTPALLAFERAEASLGSRPLRVLEYVPGEGLGEADDLEGVEERVWEDLGEAVRRLHGVALEAFASRLNGTAPAFGTWGAYVDHRVPQIMGRLLASPFLDGRAFGPMLRAAAALAHRLSPHVRPALTHRDLHPDNLVRSEGRLGAVLDFDQAEAWDPVGDFHKLEWLVFGDASGAREAFATTYGDPAGVHAHYHERLHIAGAMEFANTLAGLAPDEGDCVDDLLPRISTIADLEGWPDPARRV